MMRYFARRLLRAVLLLLAVSALSFCLFEMAPGDYFDEIRLNPAVSSETVAALRRRHGLEQAMRWRYVRWLGSVMQGDWGYSVAYNRPAAPLLWERARNTLLLTGTAVFFGWIIAVPFGTWAASGGKWGRLSINAAVSLLLMLPEILIILVLTLLAAHSRVLPVGGMTSLDFDQLTLCGKALDVASHLMIPGTALVLTALPMLLSHTRAAVAEALQMPFIAFARANGIPRRRLLFRHALPAAANPLITLLGFSAGTLLSSDLLVEAITGWPGLGQLLLQAILQHDLYIVVGAAMLSAVFLVSGNLLADLLLYAADPRIREEA